MAAGKAPVPQFGSWDAENVGYTVFFDKVRENRPAPVPATKGQGDYEFDPYEHYENLSRNAASRPASSHGHVHPAPPAQYYENPSRNAPSRPGSSHGHGHPAPQQHYPRQHGGYHRRNGSNGSSAASEVSSRASKFSPPKPYQPRYGNDNNNNGSYYQPQQQQHAAAGAYAAPRPRHHQHATPRVAASPPHHAPPPAHDRRPSQGAPQARAAKAPPAVPKFGVWEEQNATTAGQGFTVQFDTLKRNREVKKVAAPEVPPPRQLSPDRAAAPTWGHPQSKPKKSFLSKIYRCLFPVVRQ